MFFYSSLGQWDSTVFDGVGPTGEPLIHMKILGMGFLIIFLIINLVLMLNLVIAILGSVFEEFQSI
jgi:disulfide bond formation protein DsbB